MDFHEIWYLSIFGKSVGKIQVLLISDWSSGYCTWTPVDICDNVSVISSYDEKCFRQNLQRNQNTHFMLYNFLFWQYCCLSDNVEKYGTAEQATDDSTIRRMRIASG